MISKKNKMLVASWIIVLSLKTMQVNDIFSRRDRQRFTRTLVKDWSKGVWKISLLIRKKIKLLTMLQGASCSAHICIVQMHQTSYQNDISKYFWICDSAQLSNIYHDDDNANCLFSFWFIDKFLVVKWKNRKREHVRGKSFKKIKWVLKEKLSRNWVKSLFFSLYNRVLFVISSLFH